MKPRAWLLYLAALLLLAVLFSFPLILHMKEGMPYSFMPVRGRALVHQQPGDYLQLFYRFWLFGRAVAGHIPFFTNPYEFALPGTPPFFTTQGIPLSFLFIAFSPCSDIFAYNALVILSFLAAGAALTLLLLELTGNRTAAIFFGLLYASLPYRLGHLFGGHPGGFVFFLTPLALFCVIRGWRHTEAGRGMVSFLWGLAGGLCLITAALTDFHTAYFISLSVGGYLLFHTLNEAAVNGIRPVERAILPLLTGLIITAGAAGIYLVWVKHGLLQSSIIGSGRSIETVRAFSPHLKDIFGKNPNAERNIYLGIVPVLLGLYGFFVRCAALKRNSAHNRASRRRLLFWGLLFAAAYVLSMGTAWDRFLPVYRRLHTGVPFLAYSRTPSRAMAVAIVCLFVLGSFGIREITRRGRRGIPVLLLLFAAALFDYHPKTAVGISLMPAADSVYKEVQRAAGEDERLLELPIWPGDSAWSSIYEYYATLTGVPMINGYTPAVQRSYVRDVFAKLRHLNLGELRQEEYELLRKWQVRYLILHQDAFPRKVSRYPFRHTLEKLMRSPYLEFVRNDGPHFLFRVPDRVQSRWIDATLTSPVGNLYPASKMKFDTGRLIEDRHAASGNALFAVSGEDEAGYLWRGHSRVYPTGSFRVIVNIKTGRPKGEGAVARIEVYAPARERVVAEKALTSDENAATGKYRQHELTFTNLGPTRLEFKIYFEGNAAVGADYVYVLFRDQKDPLQSCEAEELYHIGKCIPDTGASHDSAVRVGKNEDLYMPVIEGPYRFYQPGRYRIRYRIKASEIEEGRIMELTVASGFGGVIAARDIKSEEIPAEESYQDYALPFELKKKTPLSFILQGCNRAELWIDTITVDSASGVGPR